jgi:hypothetical protein
MYTMLLQLPHTYFRFQPLCSLYCRMQLLLCRTGKYTQTIIVLGLIKWMTIYSDVASAQNKNTNVT